MAAEPAYLWSPECSWPAMSRSLQLAAAHRSKRVRTHTPARHPGRSWSTPSHTLLWSARPPASMTDQAPFLRNTPSAEYRRAEQSR